MVVISSLLAVGCKSKKAADSSKPASEIEQKVAEYAPFTLKTNLNVLSENERKLIPIFIQIADIMDDLFWEQSFGSENRAALDTISDSALRTFAMIQYGAWDRLDGERTFLPGYGEKPKGANFYPVDMTEEEYARLSSDVRADQYSIIRRNESGSLVSVPYHVAYADRLAVVDSLLGEAIAIADNPGMKRYLEERRLAFRNDNYFASDMAWMDMKDSRLDFVVGPIENYEDQLNGLKTAYEAFILVKDEKWSNDISRFVDLLPELQKQLPCDPKYKTEVPGTESDLNVYDVIYYAGDCNSGSKTIAINLPNDEHVQLIKGARRLQLKNAMNAKFEMILKPIASLMICEEQQDNVKFDAFFSNVCFHEVAHGLGIKNTVTGKGKVRTALGNQYSTWEEAKADICGLFITQNLIERGELKGITAEDAYVTFVAGILRSVRFGVTEAHGIANMMCFNYLQDNGAFTRNNEGKYVINVEKARAAMESWASMIIAIEGEGDLQKATEYARANGIVRDDLQRDLDVIKTAKIPRDIRYNQGLEALGLE